MNKLTDSERDRVSEFLAQWSPVAILKAKFRDIYAGLRQLKIEDDEIDQLCSIGVMESAKTFDPGRNVKFSTYATWMIRRSASTELRRLGLKYEFLPRKALRPGDDGWDRLDLFGVNRSPVNEFERAEDARILVRKLLRRLPRRHRMLVRMRYGLDGCPEHTLVELGNATGVSYTAAGWMVNWAIKFLRHTVLTESRTHEEARPQAPVANPHGRRPGQVRSSRAGR